MKIYEKAQDLWPALIKQAGLDVEDNGHWWRRYAVPRALTLGLTQDSYDSDLLYDLRAKLFPGETGSLQSLLKAPTPPVSAETLLRSFFATLRPFSMMKYDILEMMSADAREKVMITSRFVSNSMNPTSLSTFCSMNFANRWKSSRDTLWFRR